MAKERILVIDDDTAVLSAVQAILTDEGYDVLTADSGFRGLETLRKEAPDLIILDLKMPGMSGMGFLNEILGADGKPKYPVLVLTAHGTMSGFFQNIDIDGFMLKPLRGEALVKEVNRILSLRSSKRARAPAVVMSRKSKVLIAEDDDEVSNTIAGAFSRAGYATEQINNGSDAIGKAILSSPEVLVIKAVLPALNGSKVASILRTIPKTNQILIILYDQDGRSNPMRDPAQRNSDVSAFVPSSDPNEILDAAARVIRDR